MRVAYATPTCSETRLSSLLMDSWIEHAWNLLDALWRITVFVGPLAFFIWAATRGGVHVSDVDLKKAETQARNPPTPPAIGRGV